MSSEIEYIEKISAKNGEFLIAADPEVGVNHAGIAQTAMEAENAENAISAEEANLSQNAKQLGATLDVTDNAKFTYRTAGGNLDIHGGDSSDEYASIQSIHGNTIVWNQLYNSTALTNVYVTHTMTESGTVTVSSALNDSAVKMCKITTPVVGHKYYIYTEIANVDAGSSYIGIMHSNGAVDDKIPADGYDGTDWIKASGIITASEGATAIGMRISNASQIGQSAKFYGMIVRDLTKMFGAGNEPTASEFEVMYNIKDSDTPDAGSLLSFNGTGIKTVGFNLFDADTVMASKGFAKQTDGSWYGTPVSFSVWENTIGYVGQVNISFAIKHDSASGVGQSFCFKYTDGTRSTYFPTSSQGSTEWVSYNRKSDASKVVASVTATRQTSSNKTWIKDICVNFAWSGYRDGEYENYWTQTLDLSVVSLYFSNGMCSAGNVYDELTTDKAIERIGHVSADDLTWSYTANAWVADVSDIKYVGEQTTVANLLWTGGTTDSYQNLYRHSLGAGVYYKTIRVWNGSTTNQPVGEFCYELATPVETAIPASLNLTYKVDDFGTEQLLPENASIPQTAPFVGIINYKQNLVDKLSNRPAFPSKKGNYYIYWDGNLQKYKKIPSPESNANISYGMPSVLEERNLLEVWDKMGYLSDPDISDPFTQLEKEKMAWAFLRDLTSFSDTSSSSFDRLFNLIHIGDYLPLTDVVNNYTYKCQIYDIREPFSFRLESDTTKLEVFFCSKELYPTPSTYDDRGSDVLLENFPAISEFSDIYFMVLPYSQSVYGKKFSANEYLTREFLQSPLFEIPQNREKYLITDPQGASHAWWLETDDSESTKAAICGDIMNEKKIMDNKTNLHYFPIAVSVCKTEVLPT